VDAFMCYNTIRYDTIGEINVDSKVYKQKCKVVSLNLAHPVHVPALGRSLHDMKL